MNLYLPIDQSNPLVPLHAPHSIECPVFCIPGAGASVTSVEFVNALGEQWPIYGLQPRGIDIAEGILPFALALPSHGFVSEL